MARAPRIDRENGLYHVTSRGNARSRVFLSDEDRERFLQRLADNCETYRVVLYAYVLMDNHFHLVAQTPGANLSAFMQRLMTAYALYARYRHKRPGHVFQGRFKAKLIESGRYLRDVTRYVHLNPVKTKEARRLGTAQRRERLRAFRWSSYRRYVAAPQAGEVVALNIGPVLRQFSSDLPKARQLYRRYVEEGLGQTPEETLALMKGHGLAIGSEAFVDGIEAELEARRSGQPVDADVNLPRRLVSIETIALAVAQRYGIKTERLRDHGRRVGEAKAVAVELSCLLAGQTQRAVGQHFGGVTSSAVGQTRRRIRAERAAGGASSRLTTVDELARNLKDKQKGRQ